MKIKKVSYKNVMHSERFSLEIMEENEKTNELKMKATF